MRHVRGVAARRGWLPATLAGAAALCLGAGLHLLVGPARAEVADAGVVPDPGAARTAPAGPDGPPADRAPRPVRVAPAAPAAPTRPARTVLLPPTRLRVPALAVDAPVVPVGLEPSGALQIPQDPDVLGWWAGGADPGSGSGTVVLAGHIDTKEAGPGVMAHVVELPLGATVELADGNGASVAYRVVAVRSFPKTALPASVFARTGRERLVLVTCGGTFDPRTHHYSDNIVVYAVPAGG